MSNRGEKAVVLLSGGLDSSTCLAIAASEGYDCHALSIQYGQRNARELESARRVARELSVSQHEVQELYLGWIGASALTAQLEVPKSSDGASPQKGGAVPITYVPARNSVFLALAAAWAEALDTDHIYIGVNQVDFSGYPDCRPAYIAAMQQTLRLGTTRDGLVIHAPLMNLSKSEIILRGTSLGLDYGLTWSCYDPQGDLACGRCDSCIHRKKGFIEAGIVDPTPYFFGGD